MYFVFRVMINTSDTQSNSVQKYDDEKAAYKRFYSILGADIDSATVKLEIVQIVKDNGITIASEVIDNREVE